MKRYLITFMIFIITLQLFSQVKEVKSLLFGKKYTMHSKVLDEDRTIMVYDPNDGLRLKKQIDRPVIYVLDGNDHYLNIVTLLINSGEESLPKMIVVGITHNDRIQDLSPEGFNKFSSYIQEEIISFINDTYKTSDHKILIGHSLGGLFTLSTFVKKTDLFDNFISIDPYLLSYNLIPEYLALSKVDNFNFKSLYISIARTFPNELSLEQAINDNSKSTKMVREIVKLVRQIDANKNELHFKCDYFDDKTHMTVPNISINSGLNFIFN